MGLPSGIVPMGGIPCDEVGIAYSLDAGDPYGPVNLLVVPFEYICVGKPGAGKSDCRRGCVKDTGRL